MERSRFQMRVSSLLGLVALVAVTFWMFRLGWLLGFLALNVWRHVIVAYVCKASGVDRSRGAPLPAVATLTARGPVHQAR